MPRGRPTTEESKKVQERYIQIWTLYNTMSYSQFDLAKELGFSRQTVSTALKWVNKNLLKIPAKILLNGAIFAVRERMRKNSKLYELEFEKKEPSVRSIVELNREIRNDQMLLLKLQDLYKERYEIKTELDTAKFLEILTQKK